MKSILLTGASGFIGGHILKSLITENYQVTSITRTDIIKSFANDFTQIKGNFYNGDTLDQIDADIDCIINCATIQCKNI